MVKQHMSSIDVAAQVACLNAKLLGLRVANIYDLNQKTYMLKLAKSGAEGDKVFLVLESGVRFHTSQVLRDKSDIPSNFSLKLRKHIRTKRLESVKQLGVDRIVDFTFGSGESTVHLILELYAQGNLVLTDSKYEVLTLLRSHRDDDKGFAVMARHLYPMDHVRLRTRVTTQQVLQAVATAQPGMNLKGLMAQVIGYGPAVADHVLRDAGLDPAAFACAPAAQDSSATAAAAKPPRKPAVEAGGDDDEGGEEVAGVVDAGPPGDEAEQQAVDAVRWQPSSQELQGLETALKRLDDWFTGLDSAAPPGFITCMPPGGRKQAKQGKGKAKPAAAESAPLPDQATQAVDEPVVYHEFHPLRMHQLSDLKILEFPTFDESLDEFFSKIEGQRADIARVEAERSVLSKLDKIRDDQTARAAALVREAEEAELRGQLIEYNLDAVDAVIDALNTSLATGMDWHDLDRLIKDERKAGNPVAQYIHSLQLDANRATLLLSNHLDDEEEGDEAANARKATKVVIDLGMTAHANAALHYDTRKKHMVKQAKTLAANDAALKAAEIKAANTLSKVRTAPAAAIARKPHWFERFNWFITSENYLVISGRDAQQNELIVKRYFRRGDVYVHAELHGASSTIIKNPNPEQPVPPLTLQQVSKTAPTGEYLPTGSFMIRGKKTFLPPQPLVFGFGFMFKLEPSCIAAHVNERAVRVTDLDALSQAMTNMDTSLDDVDVSEMDLGIPDAEEDQGASALDRFMSGTYSHSSRANSTALSEAALSTLGGKTSAAELASQYQRYGLEVVAEEGQAEAETSAVQGVSKASSKAPPGQRKQQGGQQKDGGKGGAAAQTQAVANGAKAKPSGAPGGGAQKQAAQQAQQAQQVRGKKGKQAKVKEKYADQDEEERELAVALLASAGSKKTRADRRKERKGKKEAARMVAMGGAKDPASMAEAIAAATKKQFVPGESESEDDKSEDGKSEDGSEGTGPDAPQEQQAVSLEAPGGSAGGSGGDDEQGQVDPAVQAEEGGEAGGEPLSQEAREAADRERQEVAALLAEENVAELGDEEKEKLTVLDSLTGCPRSDDILLFAIPVCGPYNALQAYKYKIKLTPGTLKKGKAARQALELLSRGAEVNQRERELMKAIPDMDMINAMVGTVKLSMPGLTKLKQGEKAAKKSAAKQAAAKKG